jgi:hypothetical protein
MVEQGADKVRVMVEVVVERALGNAKLLAKHINLDVLRSLVSQCE